jgi:hypothetical protein
LTARVLPGGPDHRRAENGRRSYQPFGVQAAGSPKRRSDQM